MLRASRWCTEAAASAVAAGGDAQRWRLRIGEGYHAAAIASRWPAPCSREHRRASAAYEAGGVARVARGGFAHEAPTFAGPRCELATRGTAPPTATSPTLRVGALWRLCHRAGLRSNGLSSPPPARGGARWRRGWRRPHSAVWVVIALARARHSTHQTVDAGGRVMAWMLVPGRSAALSAGRCSCRVCMRVLCRVAFIAAAICRASARTDRGGDALARAGARGEPLGAAVAGMMHRPPPAALQLSRS